MEREANYVAVGAFILLVMAMAVGFVLWYTDANDGRDYELLRDLLHRQRQRPGSRQPGALPRRRRRPRAAPVDRQAGRQPRRRRRRRSIATAPISSATRASLGLQGVTGLLYINLKEVPNVDKTVPLAQGERYPVIESVASDFDVFLPSLPELMGRANALLERVGRVFSDENLEGLAETVEEPARRDRRPAADVAEHRAAGR